MTAGRINQVSFVFQCNHTRTAWYTSALNQQTAYTGCVSVNQPIGFTGPRPTDNTRYMPAVPVQKMSFTAQIVSLGKRPQQPKGRMRLEILRSPSRQHSIKCRSHISGSSNGTYHSRHHRLSVYRLANAAEPTNCCIPAICGQHRHATQLSFRVAEILRSDLEKIPPNITYIIPILQTRLSLSLSFSLSLSLSLSPHIQSVDVRTPQAKYLNLVGQVFEALQQA